MYFSDQVFIKTRTFVGRVRTSLSSCFFRAGAMTKC